MVPQTKVFVGSLPQGSKPEDLRKLFERFGVVTECDIMNRCGFVHMQTEEQATAAIRGLNNTSFNGGVISVERGRIKERGQRGGGRGGRGGMRGGMDRRGGGPMRGAPGPGRDAPYMRDARPMGHMRGHMGGGGMGARNGMPYERGPERPPPPAASYDDRYGGYGGEDRRGFALMDRGPRDPYAAPAPMYPDESRYSNHISVVEGSRRGYSAGMGEELAYDERRMYDERDVMDRRGRAPPHATHASHAPPHAGYERAPPRPQVPQADMYSRRDPMYAPQDNLRGPAGPAGYDRDPYAQQYPPMGRGGGAPRGRELVGVMGSRRY